MGICPNYKNKTVFDSFNQIIEAFGGSPMTEEEFKDGALRNQRTGLDYTAAEIAYELWSQNNGNGMEYTPFFDEKGNPIKSKLYEDLLKLNNGDVAKTIVEKSKIYTDQFKEWFGDWTAEDKENVSKVVDTNGEPLVVYHGGARNIIEFKLPNGSAKIQFSDDQNLNWAKRNGYSITEKELNQYNQGNEAVVHKPTGMYFTPSETMARSYFKRRSENDDQLYAVFLNIKNPYVVDKDGKQLSGDTETIHDLQNAIDGENDGVQVNNVRDYGPNDFERLDKLTDEFIDDASVDFITLNPNQIKSAIENNGQYSKTDNNIYHQKVTLASLENVTASAEEYFGKSVLSDLQSGKVVSSSTIVNQMIQNGMYDYSNSELSRVLSIHDIPVRFGRLNPLTLATTITDDFGGSVIVLNQDLIGKVSAGFMSKTVLHEIMHSITVDAINNPKTKEQLEFSKANSKIYQMLNKALPALLYDRNDVENGYYALTNEKEFAASFVTDETVRSLAFNTLSKLDEVQRNKFITRIKSFINAISNLFVNKDLFKNNIQQLNEYQQIINDYINNVPQIKEGNILEESDLKEYSKNIDYNALTFDEAISAQNRLNFLLNNFESNNMNANNAFDGVTRSLETRLLSIKNSILSEDRKAEEYQSTQTAIQMLDSSYVSTFVAMKNITDSVSAQLLRDIQELENKMNTVGTISFEEYQYQMHSNFGTWEGVFDQFSTLYKNKSNVQQLLDEANSLLSANEPRITEDDVKNMLDTVNRVKNMCRDTMKTLSLLRNQKVKQELLSIGKKVNADDINDFVDAMYSTLPSLEDIKDITKSFASADAIDIPGIRALTNIVNKAKDSAEEKAQDKALQLYSLAKGLSSKQIRLLYEENDEKRPTGYLTRKRNYGKFYEMYDQELIRINRAIGSKYKIAIEDSNRVAPSQEDARYEWNMMREAFLTKYADRRYIPEYYKAWAKVSQETKEQLQDITNMIKSIHQRVYTSDDGTTYSIIDKDGHPRYEMLSDEDWDLLNELLIKKKRLRSLYTIDGEKKVGQALKTALELQQLYDDLDKVTGRKNRTKKVKQWAEARLRMIYQCGGKSLIAQFGGEEEFIKFMCGEDSSFDYSSFENAINDPSNNFSKIQFDRWDDRNSKFEFKTDDEGKALIFNQIELATGGIKPDYGEEYNALNKEMKDKLNVYYGKSGYIYGSKIPNSLKKDIREIQSKMNKIKRDAISSDKQLAAVAKAYGKVFDEYVKFMDTPEYKRLKKQLLQRVNGDRMMYQLMLGQFGVTDYRQEIPVMRPYRWFQTMEAKDRHTYMHYVPGDAWVDSDSGTNFDNTEFDEKENVSMVPKLEYFDNSSRYNQIMKNAKLKALYEASYETIKESNGKQANREWADNYLLPQVLGNVFDRMNGHNFFDFKKGNWYAFWLNGGDTKLSMAWKAFKEHLGFRSENDDEIFGSEWNLNNYDESGKVINNNLHTYSSTMPDGSPYRALPQYYTKKMKDPSQISRHLVSILCSYYHMSCAFEEKAKIKAQVDSILEDLKNMQLKKGSDVVGANNEESNVFKMARDYVDNDFYNIQLKDSSEKDSDFSVTKFASTFQRWTTSRNLGLNPKVAGTGFLTSVFTHITNALTGYKYTRGDAARGAWDVMSNIIGITGSIGSHYSSNEIVLLAEMFNVSDQFDKKIRESNYGRIKYTMSNNFIFGPLASMDFISKASIMCSVLHSFRYVDGEFVTKGDLKFKRYLLGKQGYKQKVASWHKAKHLKECLHKTKDGNSIYCDPEYAEAFEKIKYVVKNRCNKYAEHADGMATRQQKAQILRNWYGGFMLLHRQYLPLMIQERFGNSVYDYDIQQYKGGQFRRLYRFFMEMAMHSSLTATAAGTAVGSIFMTPLAALLFGGIIANTVRTVRNNKQNKLIKAGVIQKDNRTFVQKLNGMFNDFSTKEKNKESQLNRNVIRQIALEVLIYKTMICPMVGALCLWADADPDDTWKQMIAYWFRGLQWEYYTPYRFDDLLNNIKSPSASTGLVDDAKNTLLSMYNTISPTGNDMLNSIMSLFGWSFFEGPDEINSDDNLVSKRDKVYGGKPKIQKYAVKLTPFRNILEQTLDSKSKRRYFENQVMGKDNMEGWISSEYLYNTVHNW